MRCPNCDGKLKTRVLKSMDRGDSILRERYCGVCAATFFTVEQKIDERQGYIERKQFMREYYRSLKG